MLLDKQLNIALSEIGEILPWWSEEDGLYLFEHSAYPYVMHGAETPGGNQSRLPSSVERVY